VASRISAPVQTVLRAHPASYTLGRGSIPRIERPKLEFNIHIHLELEVKGRVNLYLYSPFVKASYRENFKFFK
jgi:hypothetical protein